ncbi:MAG: DUF5667 domain-containing protein [Candidatus Hydrothermarchaeota archaeon]
MIKKILAIMVATMFIFPNVALAGTDAPQSKVQFEKPSIMPGSALYGLKKAWEKITLFLTFDKTERAKKRLKIAETRLAELLALAEEGNTEYTEELIDEYEDNMQAVANDLDIAESEGKNVSEVRAIVAEATLRHKTMLERARDKVPDVAKPAIEHALVVSMRGHEQALESINKTKRIEAEEARMKRKETEEAGMKREERGEETEEGIGQAREAKKRVEETRAKAGEQRDGKKPTTPGPPSTIPASIEEVSGESKEAEKNETQSPVTIPSRVGKPASMPRGH